MYIQEYLYHLHIASICDETIKHKIKVLMHATYFKDKHDITGLTDIILSHRVHDNK